MRGYVIKSALAALATLLMAACGVASALAGDTPPASSASQAGGARPEIAYHLLGFSLAGTKRVNTDALIAALPEHEGDVITAADINKDRDTIRAALEARHVHGDMTTTLLEREGEGHHVWVIWDVHLVDALSFVRGRRALRFAGQSFAGNVKLSADALAAATNLHPGDKLPDGRISDARTGIEQSYDLVPTAKTRRREGQGEGQTG